MNASRRTEVQIPTKPRRAPPVETFDSDKRTRAVFAYKVASDALRYWDGVQ